MLLLMLSINQDAGKVSGYIHFPATVRETNNHPVALITS